MESQIIEIFNSELLTLAAQYSKPYVLGGLAVTGLNVFLDGKNGTRTPFGDVIGNFALWPLTMLNKLGQYFK
jgi:hypothetical protein